MDVREKKGFLAGAASAMGVVTPIGSLVSICESLESKRHGIPRTSEEPGILLSEHQQRRAQPCKAHNNES